MKILFVITKYAGGVGRYVSETAKEIIKLGWEVEILSREDDVGTGFFSSFYHLRKEVKKRKYDILMAEDWSIALPLVGMKNLFCTFNGVSLGFFSRNLQKLVELLIKDRLIVVSEWVKKNFPRGHVIHEGVNFDFFKPKKSKKKKGFVVGFAQSTKDPLYRYGLIQEAVEEMENVEIKITGGKLKKKQLPEFYNSLDAFVSIPYKNNGFNLVWLEAMACNTTTIGNRYGVGDKLSLMIKIKEPPTKEKIKLAIKKAMKSKKKNYRKWLKDNGFTWENCARNIMEFCESNMDKSIQ